VERLYRCGDCPVSQFLGDLVLLEAIGTEALFVFCPPCGCAFERPPEGVDEITLSDEYAPKGFLLPGREHVRVAIDRGWRPRFLAVLDSDWQDRLGLQPPRN
jgi:hypothetical protein